jgi:chitinase
LISFGVQKSRFLSSWETPGAQGIGCNLVSVDDTANFLAFLQILRDQDGACDLIVSAAVSIAPFLGSDGNPITDVSEFAKVLDYIGSLFASFNFVPD